MSGEVVVRMRCRGPRVVAAATVVCAALLASQVVGSSPAARAAAPTCDQKVDLAAWSDIRLAAATVVVPAQASQVGSVAVLAHTGYGGILLFGTAAPTSLPATLARIQASTPQGLGLFVMTDEEGGEVRRLDNLVAPFPWARTMAETMTPAQIATVGWRVGTQLRHAGVTMDLAPVLDVDGRDVEPGAADPDGYRSFSGTTSVVERDGMAFLSGLEQASVIPVVKHFPGLGGASGNTDDGPAHTLPWRTLRSGPLKAFETAINAGAPAVMVSNATIPGLSKLPASISSTVITGVLRGTLHFRGLILTDSLTAGAISAVPLSVQAAAVDAIGAGADLVLLGAQSSATGNVGLATSVANAIASAIASGALPRATVAAAVTADLAARGILACPAA